MTKSLSGTVQNYASTAGKASVKISSVDIARDYVRIGKWLENVPISALASEVKVLWPSPADTEGKVEILPRTG